MSGEQMTRADRETLIKIARQRERVAKTEAKERAAALLADFETQLDRRYHYDENATWAKAYKIADDAFEKAQHDINEECQRLGIPEAFAPKLQMGWQSRGRNSLKDERQEMRRVATRQIEAAEKSARAAIERKSVDVQERIMVAGLTSTEARLVLSEMPTVDTLMPMLAVETVAGLIASEKATS